MEKIDPHCRIRSIRRKASPHLIEVMPKKRADYRKPMHKLVDRINDEYDDHKSDIAYYAVVAIGFDGSYMVGSKMHKDSPYTSTLAPAMVAECVRHRHTIGTAVDVYNGEL